MTHDGVHTNGYIYHLNLIAVKDFYFMSKVYILYNGSFNFSHQFSITDSENAFYGSLTYSTTSDENHALSFSSDSGLAKSAKQEA